MPEGNTSGGSWQDEHRRRAEMPTAAVDQEALRREQQAGGQPGYGQAPPPQGPPPQQPYGVPPGPPPQGPPPGYQPAPTHGPGPGQPYGQQPAPPGYGAPGPQQPPPPGYRQGPPPPGFAPGGPPYAGPPPAPGGPGSPAGFGAPGHPGIPPKAPVGAVAKVIGWAIVGLCLLAVLGCFGTWVQMSMAPYGDITMNGYGQMSSDLGARTAEDTKDGVLVTILALIVVIPAVIRGFGRMPILGAIFAVLGGLLTTLIGFVDIDDIQGREDAVAAPIDVSISTGWGVWLVALTGILMVLVGVVGLIKRR